MWGHGKVLGMEIANIMDIRFIWVFTTKKSSGETFLLRALLPASFFLSISARQPARRAIMAKSEIASENYGLSQISRYFSRKPL